MEQRIKEIDYIRAISAMAVIAIHVSAAYVEKSNVAYILNQTSRFAVPMFIILSGLSIFMSDKNKPITAISFIKKRFGKILIPYFFWSLLYFIFANRHHILSTDPSSLLCVLIKQLYSGTAYVHLYFLVIMFQLYLIYPYVKKWIVERPIVMLSTSFVLSLGMHLILYLHALHILVVPSIGVSYVIIFPVWIFYFVLGTYIASNKESILRKIRDISLIKLFFVWFITLMILIFDSKYTQTYNSSVKPSIILYTLLSLVFFYRLFYVFTSVDSKASAILNWYSAHSFFIYLIHPLIISLLVIYTPKPKIWYGTTGFLLLTGFTLLLSTILTYFCSRYKFIQIIGGIYIPQTKKGKF